MDRIIKSQTQKKWESRIRRLEDIEAIKKLQARYTFLLDSCQWQELVDLFSANAEAQISDLPPCRGKKAISDAFMNLFGSGMGIMSRHMIIQPVIEVKRTRASGWFYLFACATFKLPQGPTAAWAQGKYENEYIKENGKWKISTLKIKMTFRTPYEDGWIKTPMMDMGNEWRKWQEKEMLTKFQIV